jgi:TM2 domain-containing membrane protein YozV
MAAMQTPSSIHSVPPGCTAPVDPAAPEVSPKRYATAVSLSAVLGFLGIHHFYLGRVGEGLLDLGLSVGWVVCFGVGAPILGVLLLVADFGHSLTTTVLLLTGNFRDGEGRRVCYPGQKLDPWRT